MRAPTRLELHRLRYVQAGGKAGLLSYSDLGPDEVELLARDIFALASSEKGARSPYEVMASVLTRWGVMCPHPPSMLVMGRTSGTCEACKCDVLVAPEQFRSDERKAR